MLNIFAIDPQVCENLDWFKYCVEHCHPSKGRAIANLPPGEWCRRALDHIDDCVRRSDFGPIRGQSVKRRLEHARDRLVHRPGTEWNYDEPSWRKNVENEHARQPFAAVVTPEYDGGGHADLKFHPDDLDETVAAWNTRSGITISRSHDAFVDTIMPMLVVAKEIHFMDRGFNVDADSLYTRNYQKIIQNLASKCDCFPRIVIHCCPNDSVISSSWLSYFENELKQLYEPLIPTGKTTTWLIWKVAAAIERGAHPFHNRYVLSNLCGVMVGYGTDSARATTDAPETLQFIDQRIHADKLKHSKNRTHPLVSVRKEIVVTGS